MQLRPEQRLVDDRASAQSVGGVLERLVQRLTRGEAPDLRVLVGVLARLGLAADRVAVAHEQLLEVLARARVEGPEDLVDLDRRRGLRGGDREAVIRHLGLWRPRTQVEEQVALEEDARPHLHLRVLVDREGVLVELHRHDDRGGAVAGRLDPRDLPDVHAGDAHNLVALDRRRVREGRLELEGRAEGQVLREGEPGRDHDQDQRDQARLEWREAAGAPHEPPPFWPWVRVPWLPGGFVSTVRPTAYGSLPASHSRV